MKNATITTKMSSTDIERIIDRELAEANEVTELNEEDIAEIRLDIYRKYGWDEDPFPESLLPESDDEDDEPSWHSMTMSQRLSEVGMSWADFF